jgi:hypothetical protein
MFSSEFIPDNYEVRRRDRGTDDHSGVLTATKTDLIASEIHVSKVAELLTIKIVLPQQNYPVVTSYYRPPNRTDDTYRDATVKEIAQKDSILILGGEFNLPDIQWPSRQIIRNPTPTCQ